ncbi:acyl-CoA dehydrogenase family protein [Actinoplanes sp. NPDC051494]|uniref:acyl-CoA dehydrogenase family protein n=1 Tax=Actinoplanes sp. NPDC051494 TaxID=3363907 RepID=UPI0037A8E289
MPTEHDELADLVRTFFAKEVLPHAARVLAQGHPDREQYRRAGELGLLGLSVPGQYGGGGGDFTHEAVLLYEQMFAGDTSLGIAVHSGIVTGYLVTFGTEEQKRRWLPGLCSGELVGAIAMTEPDGGSDLQAMRTRAVKDGERYVVHGTKTFISNGGLADVVLVAAKTDPEQRAAGISLLICDVTGDPAGFHRGRLLSKLGLRGNDTAELSFADYRGGELLGGVEGRGFAQLMHKLPQERLVIGIGAVAAMQRAVELTTAYVKQRTAFGKPLIGHQNTRMVLAECATRARVSRVFLDDCIARHARGELDTATASMAKWWLTDGQCEVVDRCLQLFGGYGYTTEYPIAQMYADARAQKIYGGTNEIMKELIARAL